MNTNGVKPVVNASVNTNGVKPVVNASVANANKNANKVNTKTVNKP